MHPDILWAQRSDTILLTVSLSDIRNEKLSVEDTVFKFTGNAGPERKLYSVELTFHKEVVPQVRKVAKNKNGCDCKANYFLQDIISYNYPLF